MREYDATEASYKNGYEAGYKDAVAKLNDVFTRICEDEIARYTDLLDQLRRMKDENNSNKKENH